MRQRLTMMPAAKNLFSMTNRVVEWISEERHSYLSKIAAVSAICISFVLPGVSYAQPATSPIMGSAGSSIAFSPGRSPLVSLDVKDADLSQVMNNLSAQSGVEIKVDVAVKRKVTIKAEKEPLEKVLYRIMAGLEQKNYVMAWEGEGLKKIYLLGRGDASSSRVTKVEGNPPSSKWDKTNSDKSQNQEYVPGELIVKFKTGTTEQEKDRINKSHGGRRKEELKLIKAEVVRFDPSVNIEKMMSLYNSNPSVEYASPNHFLEVYENVPNDPMFNNLWGLRNTGQTGGTTGADINVTRAWDLTTGNDAVVVAVLDSGIDYDHEDLVQNLWINTAEANGIAGSDDDGNGYIDDIFGINACNSTGDPRDVFGHGTHVSGIIGAAGSNQKGVVGVNWNVRIMSCKIRNEMGKWVVGDAIKALGYVVELKARGINIVATNNSWGGRGYNPGLYDAIKASMEAGILFIAAAGNKKDNDDECYLDNDHFPVYPASYDLPNIISVSANDKNDQMPSFSHYGRHTVHTSAPGVDILGTLPTINAVGVPGPYNILSGTSMAAPHVAGLVALLKAADPSRDWKKIKNLVFAGGDDISSLRVRSITGKRVDAFGSLTCTNSPVFSVLKFPEFTAQYKVGRATTLTALSINCEEPIGPVTVTTSMGQTIVLHDDGQIPDLAANDGVFSGTWTPDYQTDNLNFSSQIGSERTGLIPKQDTFPPYTSCWFDSKTLLNNVEHLYLGSLSVTLEADDGYGSGVQFTKYAYAQTPDNKWQTYSSPFVISYEGKNTDKRKLFYRSWDKDGNVELIREKEFRILDMDSPHEFKGRVTSPTSASVTWEAPHNYSPDHYHVYFGPGSTSSDPSNWVYDSISCLFERSGLTIGTKYNCWVSAVWRDIESTPAGPGLARV